MDLGCEQALAVRCAAAVDAVVVYSCAEWWVLPLGFVLHRHHVRVGHEHQARIAGAPLKRCDEVAPTWCSFEYFGRDALLSKSPLDRQAYLGLVAGGHDAGVHRGYSHQLLLQCDDLVPVGAHLCKQAVEVRHRLSLPSEVCEFNYTYGTGVHTIRMASTVAQELLP